MLKRFVLLLFFVCLISVKCDNDEHDYEFDDASKLPTDRSRWLSAGTVSDALGISTFKSVKIPVRLNLILVGFHSDGHSLANISKELLQPWFEHVEDKLNHLYIETNPDGSFVPGKHKFKSSKIVYDFKYRVIELSDLVNTVFEAAVNTIMRVSSAPTLEYQVDIQRFSPVFESLIHYLGLSQSYTLFLWHPKKFLREEYTYGYRTGFSDQEIFNIQNDPSLVERVMKKLKKGHDGDDEEEGEGHTDIFVEDHDDDHEASPVHKIQRPSFDVDNDLIFQNLVPESEKWSQEFLKQNYLLLQRNEENFDSETCQLPPTILILDKQDDEEEHTRGHTINMKKDMSLEDMLLEQLSSHSKITQNTIRSIFSKEMVQENCLVDNWVSQGRYAFIDLSAGPFSWGPSNGGVGLKTSYIFPNIDVVEAEYRYNSNRNVHNEDVNADADANSGRTSRKLLSQEEEEEVPTPPSYYENVYQEVYVDSGYQEDNYVDDSNQDNGHQTIEGIENIEDLDIDQISLESMTLTNLLSSYCNQESSKSLLICNQIISKYQNMEYLRAKDLSEAKKRFRELGFFNLVDQEETTTEGHLPALLENFNSQMANILTKTLKKMFPVASRIRNNSLMNHLSFHIYLVSVQESSVDGFDYESFQKELKKIRLPKQEFSFTLHKMKLSDDPSLSVSFYGALHTANVTYFDSNGIETYETRTYLDSDHLRDQLMDNQPFNSGITSQRLNIFIFSHELPDPIMIDKYHQARSFDNLIVAIQSPHQKMESPYSCNQKAIYYNLRNPTKAIVSASIQSIFGTFPSHKVFEDSENDIVDDWLWSVGQGPDSITSDEYHFSAFEVDFVRRIQVVNYLDEVLENTNQGVNILKDIAIERQNLEVMANNVGNLNKIKKMFELIQIEMAFASMAASWLDFDSILEKSQFLLSQSIEFKQSCKAVSDLMKSESCEQHQLERAQFHETQKEVTNILILIALNMTLALLSSLIQPTKRTDNRVKID